MHAHVCNGHLCTHIHAYFLAGHSIPLEDVYPPIQETQRDLPYTVARNFWIVKFSEIECHRQFGNNPYWFEF